MAIYTVGRRRVIIALLLTGALLLTLDLRGNPVLDTIRDGFSRAMAPVEQATDVVTTPVQRAWSSYSNYDDLERENQALRDEIDRQRGTQAAAEASIIDYQLLLALNNLPSLSGIETAKAQVVGGATNNIDQIVEINKGSDSGIAVGMPVVNQAGLIGKITQVNATTAKVMLITDPRYSIPVEILGGTGELDEGEEPTDTTPSGLSEDEIDEIIDQSIADAEAAAADDETVDTVPDTADDGGDPTPAEVFEGDVPLPQAGDPNEATTTTTTTLPEAIPTGEEAPVVTDPDGNPIETPISTTTTLPLDPDQLEKEFGVLQGRGQSRPPQIRFLQDIPSLAVLQVGDLIETAGGSQSLAPPNIPVGRVINRADRPGVAGPLLEIELNADLDKLNFVRVVLFHPLTEVAE
jgi:rod shape-determining protein MreC